jgi:cytoskeletal protein CcmA (bactofilin family)
LELGCLPSYRVYNNVGYCYVGHAALKHGTTTYALSQNVNGTTSLNSYSVYGNADLYFRINGLVKAAIDSNGNFGIGPLAGADWTPNSLLHVSSSGDEALLQVDGSGSGTVLFVTGSGRVGIGTATPDHELAVNGNISASLNISASQFYGDGSNLTGIAAGGGGGIFTEINGTQAATTSSVSIGSSGTPAATLHVSSSGDAALLQVDGATNGTVLFVTGSGRVGIGTSTPGSLFEISAADNEMNEGFVLFNRGGANGDSTGIYLKHYDGRAESFITDALDATWGTKLQFGTSLTTNESGIRMTLDKSGSLGIGTQSPTALLHVSSSNDVITGSLLQIDSKDLGTVLFVTGSGQVGIGTNTPGSSFALDIPVSASTVRMGRLELGAWPNSTDYGFIGHSSQEHHGSGKHLTYNILIGPNGDLSLSSVAGQDMYFRIGAVVKATLDSNGQFGIGTTSAQSLLHVSSSGDGALFRVDGGTQSGSASPSPAALLFVTGSGPGSAQNTAALSGGVGIGTSTPTQVLEVFPDKDVTAIIGRAFVGYNGFNSDAATFGHRDLQGSAYALYQSAAGLTILNGASGQDMYFRINNSTKATLDSNGQFGIGTASPQSLLHVSSSTESLAGEKLFEVDGKALGSVLFATGSGRVGIRTNTPTAPLSVVGTISSSAGLMIAGPASFSGDLELSGAAFVSGALNVTGAATVTSLISLTAMSGAGGASAQTLTTDGQISGSAGLSVVGGIVGDSNIDMSGTLLVQKAGFVSGALNVSGALTSKGILLADGGAAATPASGYGAIYVTSDVLYFKTDGGSATNLLAGGGGGGAVANYNNNGNNRILTSVDSDTINGEANLLFDGSTLSSSVGGIFVGGLIISNNIDMTGTLLVQKAAFVSGALNVSGAATATSLLSLTAMSGAGGLSAQTLTTDGQISGAAGLSVVGGIVCDSSIDLTGTLLVQKAAFVSGALNVSGTITADSFSISTAMSGAGGLSAQSLTVQQNVTGSAAVQAQTLAIQAGMTVTGSSLVHGTFNAQKAQSAAVTATSVDIDVGDNHFFIIFEGTSAATASLPAVSGKTGRMYHFANMSNNDSHLVIDGDNDELVNHGLGYTMTHGGATVGLICDGAQWVLFTAYEAQEE